MNDMLPKSGEIVLGIDAMGADAGPAALVDGAALAIEAGLTARIIFFGDNAVLAPLVAARPGLAGATIEHAPAAVAMTDKPMHVLRRGRDTSMWKAIEAQKEKRVDAVISGGNTGALMAVSRMQLGMIAGVERPAVSALWPTPRGRVVVLDVGANVEAAADELVDFAIMGEAFFRALTGKLKPTVGLLNVGAEELKGHDLIRTAARTLRDADPDMAFEGFIEGDDISKGAVDVVVTDGFTGNIALKSAEGAARLVGQWIKEALTANMFARLGALLMIGGLKRLKQRIDPSNVNGGVFLGINGIVVKSHGGANDRGVKSAIEMAANLVGKGFRAEVAHKVSAVRERSAKSMKAAE